MTTAALEAANADLRAAVEARLASTTETPAEPAIPVDWILQGEAQLKDRREAAVAGWKDVVAAAEPARQAVRDRHIRPGSDKFLAVLDEMRELHLRKTMDYGVDEDAFSNISSSADIVNMPAWAGCILRIMDKMHRLKAFFRRGRTEFDGVEDTLKDIASYAVIALIKYRETRQP